MPAASDENRRPLKSRQWPIFQNTAARMARAGVSPNAISLSSIAFGAVAGVAFAATEWTDHDALRRAAWLASAACIQLRLCANLLDGLVAVEGGKGSATGELYNEVPDRLADAFILIGAGYSHGGEPMLGAVAAVVAVFVAYVRAMGASVGVGQIFLGPMAKPHRMALLTAMGLFYAFAPGDWRTTPLAKLTVVDLALLAVIVGGAATAARRLLRIAALLRQR